MNLAELYALVLGEPIKKIDIVEKYFPLPDTIQNYITLHTTSKGSKTYDFWNLITELLFPILQSRGIHILQIGAKEDQKAEGTIDLRGQTSINQTAYLIKRALGHVGVDSFPCHLAGWANIPLVALYSNNYIECVKPYFGSPEKQILIEPVRPEGHKPYFSYDENPKTINTIKPELVAESVCKLLNIPFNWDYKTVYIPPNWNNRILEGVPDQIISTHDLGVQNLVVRMDFLFNEQNLAQQLRVCPCVIVTDKPIDLNLLLSYRSKIVGITYEIDKNHDVQFPFELQKLGIKYNMISYLSTEEIQKLKINYFDAGIIIPRVQTLPDILKDKDLTKIYYRTNKLTLSKQKIYSSKVDWSRNMSIPDFNSQILPIVNDPFFWRETEQHYYLEKK